MCGHQVYDTLVYHMCYLWRTCQSSWHGSTWPSWLWKTQMFRYPLTCPCSCTIESYLYPIRLINTSVYKIYKSPKFSQKLPNLYLVSIGMFLGGHDLYMNIFLCVCVCVCVSQCVGIKIVHFCVPPPVRFCVPPCALLCPPLLCVSVSPPLVSSL